MPTATDLVTDLPADFAVFGQGVDTSMAYLLGGTTGQILSKTSATNMAFTWINNDQGDITGVTAGTGISGGGTSGTVTVSIDTAVTVDKTTAQTLTNKTLTSPALTTPTISTLTTNGDLVYGTGSGALSRLGIGSSAQVLTVSGGLPAWSTAAGGGKVLQVLQSSFTTATTIATTTFTDTGISSTITPSLATSKVLVMINGQVYAYRNDRQFHIDRRIDRSGTVVFTQGYDSQGFVFPGSGAMEATQQLWTIYLDSPGTTSTLTYKLQANIDQTTAGLTTTWQRNSYPSVMILMEIGA